MDNQNISDLFKSLNDLVTSMIPFWENSLTVSKYQKDIADNYKKLFFNVDLSHFMNLAPEFLHQTINPWSFSLFNFTKQIKGSSELEYKILTEIAGYGTQIGSITDFIEILEKMCVDPDKVKDLDEQDKINYYKFKDMVQKIHNLKKKNLK